MPNTLCVCGHEREAHEHFRRGSDCGTCGAEACPKFRRAKASGVQPPAMDAPAAPADVVRAIRRH